MKKIFLISKKKIGKTLPAIIRIKTTKILVKLPVLLFFFKMERGGWSGRGRRKESIFWSPTCDLISQP